MVIEPGDTTGRHCWPDASKSFQTKAASKPTGKLAYVCTENLVRVDEVMESPKPVE
jgi:hypothetical protein